MFLQRVPSGDTDRTVERSAAHTVEGISPVTPSLANVFHCFLMNSVNLAGTGRTAPDPVVPTASTSAVT